MRILLLVSLCILGYIFSIEHSLRLDTAEGAIAGVAGILAHPKHPPLPYYVIELARILLFSYFFLWFFSFASLALGIFFTAKLVANKNLFWGLCLTFPLIIYSGAQYNHNIALFPLWGLTLYALFNSLERGLWRDWLLLGLSVGLALWAKYAIVMLLVPFAVAIVFYKPWRVHLLSVKPYVAVLLASVIIAPHLLAVYEMRDISTPLLHPSLSMLGHFTNLGTWLFNFTLLIIPIALVVYLRGGFTKKPIDNKCLFAIVAAFGPVVFVAVLVITTGIRTRPLWFTPFILGFALWGVTMLQGKSVNTKPLFFYGFALLCLWCAAKVFSPFISNKPHYADFDARETLGIVESYVQHKPLYLVSFGMQRGRQLAGSLLFEHKIQVLEEGDLQKSPWIDKQDLLKNGAVVLSIRPITDNDKVFGQTITQVKSFTRPIGHRPFKERLEPQLFWIGVVK